MFKKSFSLIAIMLFTVFTQFAKAETEEFFGLGVRISQDISNKKIIVTEILNNTPAQKAGLIAGDEITAIDGKKVKKMCICEVISMMRGQENTTVKLRIKKNFFIRKTVDLTREKITINIPKNELFDNHWMQIATPCYDNPVEFPKEVVKKFSKKHRNSVIKLNEYWFKRKQTFQVGFDVCLNDYTKEKKEDCLIHLMDREASTTNLDKAFYKFLRN